MTITPADLRALSPEARKAAVRQAEIAILREYRLAWAADEVELAEATLKQLASLRGRAVNAMRETASGGRKRSSDRCACGKMTTNRARARGHRCHA